MTISRTNMTKQLVGTTRLVGSTGKKVASAKPKVKRNKGRKKAK